MSTVEERQSTQGRDRAVVVKAIQEQMASGPTGDDQADDRPAHKHTKTLRFVLDQELRSGWPADDDGLIEPGTMVELDLWGDGPTGSYKQMLAVWGFPYTTGLEDGASGIERVVEMIEADKRSPDDVEHWISVIGRVMTGVLPESESPAWPWRQEAHAIGLFTEFVMRRILRALVDHRDLDVEKIMLLQLARLARELGDEADGKIIGDRVKETKCSDLVWAPLTSWDINLEVSDSDNSDDVLAAIVFAAAKVGIDLKTLELGFIRDGFAIRAIRGVVQ
jgi:hypothetical protein